MSHSAIEEERRLHADDQWSGTVDLSVRANRDTSEGSAKIALADLRHDAWAKIAGSPDEARVESSIRRRLKLHLDVATSTPEIALERHAVEFWCFSPASYPAGQIPVVW